MRHYLTEQEMRDKIRLQELTIELMRDRIRSLQRALEDECWLRRQREREDRKLHDQQFREPMCGF